LISYNFFSYVFSYKCYTRTYKQKTRSFVVKINIFLFLNVGLSVRETFRKIDKRNIWRQGSAFQYEHRDTLNLEVRT